MIKYKDIFTPTRGLATGLQIPHNILTENQLNIIFYSSIGNRYIAPLVENFLDFPNATPSITNENLAILTGVINAWYNNKWERIYNALTYEYNVGDNYKRQEIENISLEGNENLSNNENVANKVFAYDSENATNDKTETTTGTNINTNASEKERNLIVSGKMGGTSIQSLIREELKLRENILQNVIFSDVKKLCTLHIY